MPRVKHTERKIKVKGFGRRLYYSAIENDVSISAAARRAGMTPAQFGGYINDRCFPSIDCLYQICMKLNVSADYLLGLTDEKGKAVNS